MTPPAADFTALVDLAGERVGSVALGASDEFFAPCERLLLSARPVWVEDRYTDRGKWMDGWESRRKRGVGPDSHDWCVVRLGVPGIVRGVVVDTAFFRGNYPAACRLLGTSVAGTPTLGELLALPADAWFELVPRTPLAGDTAHPLPSASPLRATHVRLEIYPDGGVARLRVHGEPLPVAAELVRRGELDLAAIENGGRALAASDAFFGPPHNLLLTGRPTHMGDGWETRRRRGPGEDWALVRLAGEGVVERVEVDTTHFKGNFPEACVVEGRSAGHTDPGDGWRTLVPSTRLQAHTVHRLAAASDAGPVTEVRLRIAPDGGVARLRVFGRLTCAGAVALGLRWLDALPSRELAAELRRCCAVETWIERVAGARPYGTLERLQEVADAAWTAVGRDGWRQAFAGHPRIGERAAAGHSAWSAGEQGAVDDAARRRFAELNRAYEARFGHIFLVCAAGRSGDVLAADLERRLGNDPETELAVAAGEQRRITRLRLARLVGGEG